MQVTPVVIDIVSRPLSPEGLDRGLVVLGGGRMGDLERPETFGDRLNILVLNINKSLMRGKAVNSGQECYEIDLLEWSPTFLQWLKDEAPHIQTSLKSLFIGVEWHTVEFPDDFTIRLQR